jgi:DNA repair exonuclease SbcCD ATPase subunit
MIQQLRNKLEQKKGQRDILLSQQQSVQDKVNQHTRQIAFAEKAQLIIQHVAKQTQQELEIHISNLVSMALSSIFPNPYEFQLEFTIRRNKTEADLWFIKKYRYEGLKYKVVNEKMNPLAAAGGGPCDVASFAIRVALWSLKNPRSRNILILDEPFKNLSNDLQPKASQLLKELSDKLNLQILMVTHSQDLIDAADKVFSNNIENGVSKVEEG